MLPSMGRTHDTGTLTQTSWSKCSYIKVASTNASIKFIINDDLTYHSHATHQYQAAVGLRSARHSGGDNRQLPPQFTVTVNCGVFRVAEEQRQENTLNDFW